ncbi:hypothetical protein NIES2119_30605 [[Phormidium ambiguum] IAM M-71]|uniref:NACHT conflict system C-terminal helical domain-containing protein n=1 Tax=[Phormidium ambiguum] IAM M-71 TaxID=454136 RepID=A0A1U7I395_9CYAN|nr:hypothetical protein [Phormidium ambiguum]OKH30598.1 hypothetical protein NIES2119_30605 [Phormidium ambiguum IAM M-71]
MNSTQAVESLRMMKLEIDALVAEDSQLQQLLSWIKLKSLSVRSDDKPAKVRAFYLAVVSLLGLPLVRNFDPNRASAKARQFATSFNRVREVALDLGFNLNPNTDPAYVLVSILAQDIDPQLKQTVQQLIAELPDPKEEREKFETWRQTNGLEWVAKLTDVLGIDFQLSDKQRELLKRYYSDNKLLLEYLNSVSNLTPTLRAEIEEGLFLPID